MHSACVTAGAAGTRSSHDAPANVTVNVAVMSSTRTQGSVRVPQPYPSSTVAVTVTGVVWVPS